MNFQRTKTPSVIILLALFIVVALTSSSSAQASPSSSISIQPSPALAGTRYIDSQSRFSITLPKDWVKYDGASQYFLQVLSPYEQGGETTCYLAVWTEDSGKTLQQEYNESLQAIRGYQNVQILSETSDSVAGYASKQVVYNCTSHSIDLKVKEAHFVEHGKHLMVTYIAVPTAYDTYLSRFDESAATFRAGIDPYAEGSNLNEWLIGTLVAIVIAVPLGAVGFVLARKKKKNP